MKRITSNLLLLSLVLGLSGCEFSNEPKESNSTIAPKVVKIFALNAQNMFKKRYEYPAEVYAQKHADMAFEVSGKIVKSPTKVGDKVKKGTLLAKLDDTIFRANVKMAKANYDKAKSDYTRYKQLYVSNNISLAQFEQVKQARNVSRAQYDVALKTLSNTKLIADFDGVIAKKLVNDFARVMAKQPILILEETHKLKIKFFIPENDITQSSKKITQENVNSMVDFYVTVGNETKYKAKLLDVATNAQKVTRTYEATLLIDNPKKSNIFPGMTAKVEVLSKVSQKAQTFIPLHAVFSDKSNESYVWVVNENKTVSKQKVQTASVQGKMIEITQGLDSAHNIVSSGVHVLKEGDQIQAYKKLGN